MGAQYLTVEMKKNVAECRFRNSNRENENIQRSYARGIKTESTRPYHTKRTIPRRLSGRRKLAGTFQNENVSKPPRLPNGAAMNADAFSKIRQLYPYLGTL